MIETNHGIGKKTPRHRAAELDASKGHHGIVRWHVDDLGKLKAAPHRRVHEISTVANTPPLMPLAEMSIEGRMARHLVHAFACKSAINDQQDVCFQVVPSLELIGGSSGDPFVMVVPSAHLCKGKDIAASLGHRSGAGRVFGER